VLTNLGLGVAGSYGSANNGAASNLPAYKSVGQQTIFTYIPAVPASATALAAAAVLPGRDRWRVSPQMYWYLGPVGILAEYVLTSQSVQRNGETADIQARAWNLTGTFVLTLEHASYEGVTPRRPVDFRHPRFGAFELAFRYSELRIDDAAFPDFADPAVAVHSARELAGGLTWHMTEFLKVMMSYHRTDFVGGAATGNREAENALMARLQLAL
jgi:phosphate-selective porin OprO/OprP